MTAKIIVFEGLDCSGKETQCRLLVNYLRDMHKTVSTFSFPNYSSWSGQRIRRWLDKQLELNQYEVNMLYSLNRYEMKDTLDQCIKDYDYVILDRYYHSNWVYGRFKYDVSLFWLTNLDRELPEADLVFLCDISGETSAQRRGSMADIHESDIPFLNQCRLYYLALADQYKWEVLAGEEPPEKIHAKIITKINPKLTL